MSQLILPNCKVFIYDPVQKPDLKALVSLEKFESSFLKSTQDTYPRSSDDIEELKNQIAERLHIGPSHKIEHLLYELPKGLTYHNGYLNYLLTAWQNDCGIEVGPWHIWNIVLHQLCQTVNGDPEKYRSVFTTKQEKTTITFTDGEMFDIDRFINAIRDHIPLNIDTFVPQFPGQPPFYRQSMYGLFADMVQEYYECSIQTCSIPKVRILGTDDDWISLIDTTKKVQAFFTAQNIDMPYLTAATKAIFEMVSNLNNPDYWKNFFSVVRCGSGSNEEISGHVIKLLIGDHKYLTCNIPDMISRFPFEFLPNGSLKKDMNFVSGVLYSTLDDGFLIPHYYCSITQLNMDSCKMTPQDIQSLESLLKFMKMMNRYDEKYKKRHVNITSMGQTYRLAWRYGKEIKAQLLLPIDNFDDYVKRHHQCDVGLKKALEKERKKVYRKYVKFVYRHNERVNASNGSYTRYLELLNMERVDKLKKAIAGEGKYHFWSQDRLYLESDSSERINAEKWKEFIPKQEADVKFILDNFDLIYDYIADNHHEAFRYGLLKMYNPRVLKRFFDKYKEKPFKMESCGWSCYDSCINPNGDMYTNLIIKMFECFDREYLDPFITRQLKQAILPDDLTLMMEARIYSLRKHVEGSIRIVDLYYEGKTDKLREELINGSLIVDIRRYNYFFQLIGIPSNYIAIINDVLKDRIQVDEDFFKEKLV